MSERPAELTLYDAMGGHDFFSRLVHRFYQGVAEDPLLRSLYPEEDLSGAERRLLMFLEQYWGGPKTYQQERGHPRLRMRHAPFAVSPKARDRWLAHMRVAVDEAVEADRLTPELEQQLWAYFEHAANFMVNTFDEG
ncbi:MAG: globin [Nocardioidaceae bacterium]